MIARPEAVRLVRVASEELVSRQPPDIRPQFVEERARNGGRELPAVAEHLHAELVRQLAVDSRHGRQDEKLLAPGDRNVEQAALLALVSRLFIGRALLTNVGD